MTAVLRGGRADRTTTPNGRTCPNRPPCPHGLVLHDIPEQARRREVCTVADCRCGRTT